MGALPLPDSISSAQSYGVRGYEMMGTLRKGQILMADQACNSDARRKKVAVRGAWANIRPMPRRVCDLNHAPVEASGPSSKPEG